MDESEWEDILLPDDPKQKSAVSESLSANTDSVSSGICSSSESSEEILTSIVKAPLLPIISLFSNSDPPKDNRVDLKRSTSDLKRSTKDSQSNLGPIVRKVSASLNESDTPENRLRITDCITKGDFHILEVLVQKSIDPNMRAENGTPPLVYAVQLQNIQVVKILLSSPVLDINVTDVSGQTALIAASKIPASTEQEQQTSYEIKKLLLAVPRIDTNLQDLGGTCALLYAVCQKDFPFVEDLMRCGADPVKPNSQGNTPLHTACSMGDEKLVHLLCSQVEPSVLANFKRLKNWEQKTPLNLTQDQNIKHYLEGKKTSVGYPLQVQWITHPLLPPTPARLGITMCMGRNQRPWARDLQQDLQAVSQHQPNTIITFITNTELKEMGLAHMEVEIDKASIESCQCSTNKWMPSSLTRFVEVLDIAKKRLAQGKTVIFQCDDGVVRNGLAIAALLVLCGSTTSEASTFVQNLNSDMLSNPTHVVYLFNYQKRLQDRPVVEDKPEVQPAPAAPKTRTKRSTRHKDKKPVLVDQTFTI